MIPAEPTPPGSIVPGAGSQAPPELGVVIVSFNTRDLLDACLRALVLALDADLRRAADKAGPGGVLRRPSAPADLPRPPGSIDDVATAGVEVWVVDNGSADGSADLVARDHPWVHLLRNDENIGFTAANNLVLRRWLDAPTGPPPFTLLLNPDTEPAPNSIAVLRTALEASPTLGLVGPALEYPDGRFQHAAFRFPGIVQAMLDLWPVERLQDQVINGRYPRARYAAGAPFDVDFVLGACMLIRRDAFRSIGALDERFFMYCEEIDWCLRLRERGWRVACVPEARVVHHGGASTSKFRSSSFVHLWRSRRRLMEKHASKIRRRLFDVVVASGFVWRALLDRITVRRGRMRPEEGAERRRAYRAVWTDGDSA